MQSTIKLSYIFMLELFFILMLTFTTFPNCIKFFVKYNDGTFSDTAFACYDWCTDTIYRFNTYCVSLSIDNELFEKTKESVINELFGR